MKVFEAIAGSIIAEQCGALFGLMGDGNMLIWGALGRHKGFPIFSARHEASAIGMADGYHRATGRVAVATTTWGPGLTQATTPLIVAARNRSGLVLIAGQQSRSSRDPHQVLDHKRFADFCEVEFHEIKTASDAPQQIAEAFYAARVRRSTVLLNLPLDIQLEELEWDWNYRPSWEFLPAATPMEPDREALRRIYERLSQAERPVIIAGMGARTSGARDQIMSLAERSGALLATSLKAKGFFSDQAFDIGVSGTLGTAPAERLFADADFVLSLGAELGHYTTEGGLLYPAAELARIDVKAAPDRIGPVPGLYARGDAGRSAELLTQMFDSAGVARVGYRTEETRQIIDMRIEPEVAPNDGLDPRKVMTELSKSMPRNSRIVTGVGHYWGFVCEYLAVPPEAELQMPYQFGSIAQALSQSIGMAAGGDGRPNILIEGDGSLLCHVQEIAVAVRHGLQLAIVVLNDSGFGAEVHKLKAKGLDPSLAQWDDTDFVKIAQAFGAEGVCLKSEEDIGPAIKDAIASGKVVVIDARISPTTVTEDFRKLFLGQENRAPVLRTPAVEPAE